MEQNAQRLKDWLEAQVNRTVVITKRELNDLDTVHFNLEDVEYRDTEGSIDDYLDSALILKGNGHTMNKDGDLVPLPQHSYEIAVSGLALQSVTENAAELHTDRGKYTLALD